MTYNSVLCSRRYKVTVNSLRPRRDRRHFADDIFKCVFLNENEWISLKISPKFVPKVRINNIPSLVQIMVWRRPGDKPLSEPMMVSLPTQICVNRPQWVNSSPRAAYMPQWTVSSLVLVKACRLFDWTPENIFRWNMNLNSIIFIQENANENIVCQNGDHFVGVGWRGRG